MSTIDPKGRSEGEERAGAGSAEEPGSFVQRLRRAYGKTIDPRISLQEESVEEGSGERRDQDSSGSSTSRDLVEKLAKSASVESRYRIHKEIARGGMGTILRVWDDELRRNLAMKVMHGSSSATVDEERLSRFLEEAQITGQLDHPGIVPVHSLGVDEEGRCYFTMRLVRGRELKEVLDLTREDKEGWTITRALALILKVCEAMAFAHSKGVVHRDLKPANIMVGRFGEVYVMDWGLARVLGRRDSHDMRLKRTEDASMLSLVRTVRRDESSDDPESPLVTMDGDVVGTPSYMAPEQALGQLDKVGPRSDVYSLGAILYFMLTGRAPYVEPGERISSHTVLSRVLERPPQPVRKLAKDVPGELVAICEKAMARDADERYEGMLALAEEIQAFLENRVVRAYEGGAIAEFRKWVARNRATAGATAALILISIASALGFGLQKMGQVDALNREKAETEAARAEAQTNLELANASAAEAEANLELALSRKEEADQNARIALDNAELAHRSSYMANLIAADFSLRLHDVVEARRRLDESDPAQRGWEWDHLRLRCSPELATFGGGEAYDAFALTPDSRVLGITRPGHLKVMDALTGEVLPPHDVFNVALSFQQTRSRCLGVDGSGTSVALGGLDGAVRLYDLTSGEQVGKLPAGDASEGHDARITALGMRPDGRLVASGDEDGSVLVWDIEARTIVARLSAHGDRITALSWSPDSVTLASASVDETVHVWDALAGEVRHVLRHPATVIEVAFDPTGAFLASGGLGRTVDVWDLGTGVLVDRLSGHQGSVNSVDFHPHGGRIASAGDLTVRIWDLESGRSEVLVGHEGTARQVRFAADGERLVSLGDAIKTWDAAGDSTSSAMRHHERMVNAVSFSPSPQGETRVLTASDDGTAAIWDADAAELLFVLRGHEGTVHDAAFSPDGRTILTGAGDKLARLWDAERGKLLATLEGHGKWVSKVAWAPDGSWFVTGSGDGVLRAWDTATHALLHERADNPKWLRALAVSPDGSRIATGGVSHDIVVWRLWDEEPEFVLPGHENRGIQALVFSPDGTRLVSAGSTDHTTRIWDLETGENVKVLRGHEQMVTCLAFSPDGMRLATGSMDRTIRLWDLVSDGSLLVLRGHESEVTSLGFSPDGARLVSGSRDATARLWESGRVAELRALRRASRTLRAAADPIVEQAFADHFFAEDVVLRLRAQPDLPDELREACVRRARIRGDAPALLDRVSREVVVREGEEPEVYQTAVRRCLAACSLDRQDPRLLCTLGMAQYRAGELAAAVGTLSRARETAAGAERAAFGEADRFLTLTFLAMARFRTGEPEEGRTLLKAARAAFADVGDPEDNAELGALLDEAEDVLTEG